MGTLLKPGSVVASLWVIGWVVGMSGCMIAGSMTGRRGQSVDVSDGTPLAAVGRGNGPLHASGASGRPAVVAGQDGQRLPRRLPPMLSAERPGSTGPVQLVAHVLAMAKPEDTVPQPPDLSEDAGTPETLPAGTPSGVYPIDLANALALGGASSLQIRLARERVIESQARWLQARATWLPSLRGGIGYNRHDGQLQATEGDVIQAGRNSLFVGGGAGLGGAPLTGGAGGPPRLFVNLSLSDALFEPMVARRLVAADSAAENAAVNDALLAIATAYYDLVESHGLVANAQAALTASDDMLRLAGLFAREGRLSDVEVDRARTERAAWRQAVEEARRLAAARSAELARLLRLDGALVLVPVEDKVAPLTWFEPDVPRDVLIAQGLTNRPELAQYGWLVQAALKRLRQEHWRPWLPNVQAGASGGTFGGGQSGIFDNQAGRGDLDLLAIWEWRNLGIGNHGLRRERASQIRQARMEAEMVRDRIVSQIVTAASDVASYRRQMQTALRGIAAAQESYQLNRQRLEQDEGLPIELLQAIRARARAQDAYTQAVSDYNRSQFRMLRAVGQPIDGVPVAEAQ